MAQAPILDVQDLKTYFFTRTGVVKAVDGVSFSLMPGGGGYRHRLPLNPALGPKPGG